MGCGDRSQTSWLAMTQDEDYEIKHVATYLNEEGQEALLLQDTDSAPYVHVIFNDNGSDRRTFYADDEEEGRVALEEADAVLRERGFKSTLELTPGPIGEATRELVEATEAAEAEKSNAVEIMQSLVSATGSKAVIDADKLEGIIAKSESDEIMVQGYSLKTWAQFGEMNDSPLGAILGHVHPDFGDRPITDLTEDETIALSNSMTKEESVEAAAGILASMQRQQQMNDLLDALKMLEGLTRLESLINEFENDENPFAGFNDAGKGFFSIDEEAETSDQEARVVRQIIGG